MEGWKQFFDLFNFFTVAVTIRPTLSAVETCSNLDQVMICDFEIPNKPVAQIVKVPLGGVNTAQCWTRLTEFKWDIGIICAQSHFCGLGIDMEGNYFDLSTDLAPLEGSCKVVVNKNEYTCDKVKHQMHSNGIIKGQIIFEKQNT